MTEETFPRPNSTLAKNLARIATRIFEDRYPGRQFTDVLKIVHEDFIAVAKSAYDEMMEIDCGRPPKPHYATRYYWDDEKGTIAAERITEESIMK